MSENTVEQYLESNIFICKACGGKDYILDQSTGELCCTICGSVERTMALVNVQSGGYGYENQMKSLQTETTRYGLGTSYGQLGSHVVKDTRKMDPNERIDYFRKKRLQRQSHSVNRTLVTGRDEINGICQILKLPSLISNQATQYFTVAYKEHNVVRGRSIFSVALACVYLACREHSVPKTIKQFKTTFKERFTSPSTPTSRSSTRIAGTSRNNSIAGIIRLLINKGVANPRKKSTCVDYAKRLQKDEWFQENYGARKFFSQITQLHDTERVFYGKSPIGGAAACLYITSKIFDLNLTQVEISQAITATEVTIRNRTKDIIKKVIIEVLL